MNLSEGHIKKINTGDINAFKQMYNEMFNSLCLYGFKIYPSEDVVQDAVQETFIILWNKRSDFNSLLGTKSYLYTTVRNKLLNAIRDSKTSELNDQHPDEAEFELQITKEETYKILHDAIDDLPDQTRRIIKLAVEGCSNIEIAESIDVSINTVKTLKRRGFASLRETLKDNIHVLMLLAQWME